MSWKITFFPPDLMQADDFIRLMKVSVLFRLICFTESLASLHSQNGQVEPSGVPYSPINHACNSVEK